LTKRGAGCHREERSDEAISGRVRTSHEIVSLRSQWHFSLATESRFTNNPAAWDAD
jgi:hypothetical protein